jgi:hypothetical protein
MIHTILIINRLLILLGDRRNEDTCISVAGTLSNVIVTILLGGLLRSFAIFIQTLRDLIKLFSDAKTFTVTKIGLFVQMMLCIAAYPFMAVFYIFMTPIYFLGTQIQYVEQSTHQLTFWRPFISSRRNVRLSSKSRYVLFHGLP